ncbi:MAG: YdiL family protein [Burkholderiales bacterium]|jgi:hypothetical protein|nr:YdiL family protein [Burkholderiales bacterium]
MTPEELRNLRTRFCYTVEEAAYWIGETTIAVWQSYEDGKKPVPKEMAERMEMINLWFQATVDSTAQHLRQEPQAALITLIWYDDINDWLDTGHKFLFLWRAYLQVCLKLKEMFNDFIVLHRFDKDAFAAWVKENHLQDEPVDDNLTLRWASETTLTTMAQTPTTTQ